MPFSRDATGAGRLVAVIVLLSVVTLLAACAAEPHNQPATVETASPAPVVADRPAPIPPAAPVPVSMTIAAVGDIMLGTDFPENHLPDDDGASLLASMTPILSAADVTFGNLEGTLLSGGEPAKQCRDPDHCWLFRSPPRYARWLAAAGFDVLSLANNHARDFGEAGREASMQALAAAGIAHTGQDGDVAILNVRGRSVAVIAYAPFRNAHDMLDIPAAVERIRQLAVENDIVVVSMHAGAEGADRQHVPFAEEFYYGENRGDVVAFAHAMIDAGADLVIGHGPHVPRALELYRDRLVAYSLGNFCTYYGISVAGPKGLAPVLLVRLDGTGRFLDGRIVSARQFRPAGPMPDPGQAAAAMMARLIREDFPGTALEIAPDGSIRRTSHLPTAFQGTRHRVLADKLPRDL